MRFLVDECTGSRVARWLREEGHEVFSVYDEARGISDEEIARKAFTENWILIINDKDFGEKVYREQYPHHGNEGIVWLRGFKDYKTPDPNCDRCNGTGKYGIVDFLCYCNKPQSL